MNKIWMFVTFELALLLLATVAVEYYVYVYRENKTVNLGPFEIPEYQLDTAMEVVDGDALVICHIEKNVCVALEKIT